MTMHFRKLIALIACLTTFSSIALAQQQPQPEKIPVKMQIVISRYEGDKKISSLPFTLLTITNGRGNIRNGAQVPVLSSQAQASGTDGKPQAAPTFNYTSIGTNIDCNIFVDSGRFRVELQINDSSVMDESSATAKAGASRGPISPPVLRNFSMNNIFFMKDGETKQFVSAPDRTVGDVTKVDVTLTTEK